MKPQPPSPDAPKGPIKQPGPASYGFGGYGPAKPKDSKAKDSKKGWRLFGR